MQAVPTAAPPVVAQNPELVLERVDFHEMMLRDAVRALSEESGVNIVASEEAGAKTISLFLQKTTLKQTIEALAKSYDLWYRDDDHGGVLRMMTAKEYQRDLTTFRDEKTTVYTLLYPNAMDVGLAIRSLFGDRVRLAMDRETMYDDMIEMQQRFQRFDLLQQRAQGLSKLNSGANNSGYGGNLNSFGGGGGLYNSFGSMNNQQNALQGLNGSYGQNTYNNNTDSAQQAGRQNLTPENLQNIDRQKGADNSTPASAVDLAAGRPASIYVSVVRKNNMVAVRTSDSAAMQQIEQLVKVLDVATPQVLLEVKILSIDLADDFNSVFGFDFQHRGHTLQSEAPATTGVSDARNLVYKFVNNELLTRLQLLEEKRRVSTLATPILLVANNEVARVFIGEERPVVRNVITQSSQNQSQTLTTGTTQTDLVQVGTTLLITPNVNADRTVTLRIVQESAQIKRGDATIPVVVNNEVVNQAVDVVASRNVTGTVIAKDGLALALGGLIEESISDSQAGVPLLMDLPLIGFLFRKETKSRSRTELVVFVRPFVLLTANEGIQLSEQLSNRLQIHPEKGGVPGDNLGTFKPEDAPRGNLGSDPLKEMFKYQSGLPGKKE